MTNHRRSALQVRIMLQLEQSPAKSITALASKLDVERSSVSRSLHALKEQGVAIHSNQGWRLTEIGADEIPVITQTFTRTLEDTSKIAERATQVILELSELSSPDSLRLAAGVDGMAGHQELMRIAKQHQSWASSMLPRLTAFDTIASISEYMNQIQAMVYPPSLPTVDIGMRDLQLAAGNVADFRDTLTGTSRQAVADMLRNMSGGAFSDLARFNATLTPLLDTQDRVNDFIRSWTSSIDLVPMVKPWLDNNVLLSHAIDEIRSAYESVGHFGLLSQTTTYDWIAQGLVDVNQAYGALMNDRFSEFDQVSRILPSVSARIVPPTASVSYFAQSSHEHIRAAMPRDDVQLIASDRREEFGAAPLDDLLMEIDPLLVEKRHGAWTAYNKRGADWIRHASVSQRELIVHLLDKLVPRDTLNKEESDTPRIIQQVKVLFGRRSSDSDYASALGKALQETYRQHNKYTHGDERHVASFRALLHSTEWWLVFILESSQFRDD